MTVTAVSASTRSGGDRDPLLRLGRSCDPGSLKGHDRRYSIGWTKIRTELGYRPGQGFQDGPARTVTWYRANRAWWEALKQRSGWTAGAAGVTGMAP